MNVAFFVGRFPLISETFILRQVIGLVEAGNNVTVISSRPGDFRSTHKDYVDYKHKITSMVLLENEAKLGLILVIFCALLRSLLTLNLKRFSFFLLCIKNRTLRVIVDIEQAEKAKGLGNYDAIIAHFGDSGISASYLRKFHLIDGPIAVVFHGADMTPKVVKPFIQYLYQSLFNDWDLLLPVSEFWKKRLISWGAQPNKIQVLRMGVDVDKEEPITFNERVRSDSLNLISVGRFTEKKGFEYSIKGVSQVTLPLTYDIIGFGELEEALSELSNNLSSNGVKINLVGKLLQHEIMHRLKSADIFILTSVTAEDGDMEGIPVALMEAMMSGVIVISTYHSGIPELVIHEKTGFLVPERDSQAITELINRIASNQYDLALIAKNAREHVIANFNNRKLIQQLDTICKTMCTK